MESGEERSLRLKRLAIQIVAQMPEREADAFAVLEYVEELLTGFLRPRQKARLSLVKDESAPAG
jgi:hypothetical protein